MGFWSKQKAEFKEARENIKTEKNAIRKGEAGTFHYLGGHPDLVSVAGFREITIWKGQQQNQLILQQSTGNKFKYEVTVTKLEWDQQGKRSAGKAAAGAIIGGVLTGGVGLLAGAAIGGRKKDDSIAIMTCSNGVIEFTLYFKADNFEYQQLARLLS